MVAVWVVVGILSLGVAAVAVASRRQGDDVEPSVREFTEFRDAISRQVAGVDGDMRVTRRHLGYQPENPPAAEVDPHREPQPRS